MSSLLYSLGRWAYRARRLVLAIWIGIIVVIGAAAGLLAQPLATGFSIPGTESQEALDTLSHNFPQVSGSSAQMVVVAPQGQQVRQPAIAAASKNTVAALEKLDGVSAVSDPLNVTLSDTGNAETDKAINEATENSAKANISSSGRAAIISVQLEQATDDVPASLTEQITAAGEQLQKAMPTGSRVQVGGEAFQAQNVMGFSITEVIGLLIATMVLFAMFRSFVAAGLPLLTAVIGVIVTLAGVQAATIFADISSTAPSLALMLGLAVGIDYALFVLSRHIGQLRTGMDPEESVARSVATAGSAVIFAGLTVIIALLGLSVVNIPFLTVMGIAAAVGVGVAVLICLTLTPALLGFASRPMVRAAQRRAARGKAVEPAETQPLPDGTPAPGHAAEPAPDAGVNHNRFLDRWVRIVTRIPLLTIAAVVVVVALMAYPALDMRLALPDAGSQEKGTPARDTYDLIADQFGPGFNGPLIVTGTIVTSDDPLQLMTDLKQELLALPDVAAVPVATPNEDATTGILQVVPKSSPDSVATKNLVQEIRDLEPQIKQKYGIDIAVTGFTAIGIDVSDLLGKALVPFIALIMGLSVLLLTMVFRSIWVPLKATLGFLFSIGGAFGAVSAVFSWGWLNGPLNVTQTGPVISFMPIILIGVLFGLAMDYEVFLVSRMREEYVHGATASEAIRKGFMGSGQVVIAAALIMISVFAAFVPHGDGNIKPIALGLAVGVFVDAFLVRMVLVPAVLQLLGDHAWWFPRWLDRLLPAFDVEGEGLSKELALAGWPVQERMIAAERLGLTVRGATLYSEVDLDVAPGEVLIIQGHHRSGKSALAFTIGARVEPSTGRLKVAGYVVPQRGPAVRSRAAIVSMNGEADPVGAVRAALAERPELLIIDDLDDITDPGSQHDILTLLTLASQVTLVVTCVETEPVFQMLPPDRHRHVHMSSDPGLDGAYRTPKIAAPMIAEVR